MAPKKLPDNSISNEDVIKADIAKLHAEINNYVNHQYILYVAGVTLVGLVMAWVSQQLNPADFKTLDIAYLGCSAVLLFLCIMNVLDFRLEVGRTICATYMRISGWSIWEKVIEEYKDQSPPKRWLAVTSRHGYYVFLGFIAALWPIALAGVVFRASAPSLLSMIHVGVSIAYAIFTLGVMPRVLLAYVNDIERGWNSVLRSAKSTVDE